MPTKYEPSEPRPYKIGHKIRILLGRKEGDHTVTFGRVVSVGDDNVPVVRYRDYSGLKLGEFDRIVKPHEVLRKGKFQNVKWEY